MASSDHRDVTPGETDATVPRDTTAPDPSSADLTGTRIGPYALLYRIGAGGMGEVWAAQQTEPLRRRVALKIIKAGMDSAEVLARFDAERRALALLDHPYVAKVFDAGTTLLGRPYFVMELVEGVAIHEYCDAHDLSIADRIELFVLVCAGVQHAHQRTILHRDLKSSNVLVCEVDGRAVPKIIDFGLAKAMGSQLTECTLHTAMGQVLGTPAYMSPEQAWSHVESLDTRTDVYSLGVMLYQLLTGELPLDPHTLEDAGYEQLLHFLRDTDPLRPSARVTGLGERLSEVASCRRVPAMRLRKRLQGDLDWITMKALEKDRNRRYESVAHLVADLRRHLDHQPVLAGPPSRVYRLRKFVRRHRTGVALGTLGAVALAVFTVGMAVQSSRIREQAGYTRQVSDFMTNLFLEFDPVDRGSTVSFREVLDEGARRAREELEGQPLVQARMMMTLGGVYRNFDLYEQAEPLLEGAVQRYEEHAPADHAELGVALMELAMYHRYLGAYARAESLYRRALPILERAKGEEDAEVTNCLHGIGVLCRYQARYDEAEAIYGRVLAIRRRVLGEQHPGVAKILSDMAVVDYQRGNYEQAIDRTRQALEIRRATLPPTHASIAESYNNLGVLSLQSGSPEEARDHLDRALQIRIEALGADHTEVAQTRTNLGSALESLGDLAAALEQQEAALAIYRQSLGPEHTLVAQVLGRIASLHRHAGELDRAREFATESVRIQEKSLGPDHPAVADGLVLLGQLHADRGELDAADACFERALSLRERAFGLDSPRSATTRDEYAAMLDRTGRAARAESLRVRAPVP